MYCEISAITSKYFGLAIQGFVCCPKCTAMLDCCIMVWCMQLEFDMHVRMVPRKKWEHVGYHGNKSASIRLLDPLLPHIMMKKYSTH